MTVVIIGAGMAGLLAANMLHRHNPVVVEAQPSLPNNHHAILRFRSNIVSEVLGVPFKKVTVRKGYVPWRNPVADALSYSKKANGSYQSDRSIGPAETVERYIAPPDLIERMAKNVKIQFNSELDVKQGRGAGDTTPLISTMPMPSLMDQLDYPGPRPEFRSVSGVVIRLKVRNCDAYATLYVPDPDVLFSRLSVTGDEVIIEFPNRNLSSVAPDYSVLAATQLLGVQVEDIIPETVEVKEQRYSKIIQIDEILRRNFLHWCSTINGYAYSLGRYATWRPGLLLDDLVKDVRIIEKMFTNQYDPGTHFARKP